MSCDEARLARAGRTDERDRAARLHVERGAEQRRLGRALVVQRDVAQLDVPRPRRKRDRVRRRDDPRLAVEDLEEPRARGRRALGHAQRDAQRAHRRQQHEQVGVEGREVADAEAPVDDLAAAVEQDRGQPELGQEADQRVVERLQPGADHRLVEHPPDALAKALELALLAREGLDDAHARDVLLDLRRQLGDPLLHLLQRGPARGARSAGRRARRTAPAAATRPPGASRPRTWRRRPARWSARTAS